MALSVIRRKVFLTTVRYGARLLQYYYPYGSRKSQELPMALAFGGKREGELRICVTSFSQIGPYMANQKYTNQL